MKKKLLIVLLAVLTATCLTFGIAACDLGTDSGTEQGGTNTNGEEIVATEGLEYTLSDDGKYYIVSGIGTVTATDIVIPSTYDNLPVEKIGEQAFLDCTSFTGVTIPDSVISIGDYSFYNCTSLTSITIPDSVTSIGGYAFYNCTSLTSITIPDGVTSIGHAAFYNCTSLTSITIPDSVTSIGNSAFYNCSSLTSVTIGNSVTSIGSRAFFGCTSIEAVYITDIAAWCNIYFYSVEGDVASYANPLFYAGSLYLNGELVTDLIIPEGVTTIGMYMFEYCTSLTSVTIPDSVTYIDYGAFMSCSSLTSITIPDSITTIGREAFYGCSSLASVTFENTEGWWYARTSLATSGTSISSEDLADPATAATYLTSTYYNYNWKRG